MLRGHTRRCRHFSMVGRFRRSLAAVAAFFFISEGRQLRRDTPRLPADIARAFPPISPLQPFPTRCVIFFFHDAQPTRVGPTDMVDSVARRAIIEAADFKRYDARVDFFDSFSILLAARALAGSIARIIAITRKIGCFQSFSRASRFTLILVPYRLEEARRR